MQGEVSRAVNTGCRCCRRVLPAGAPSQAGRLCPTLHPQQEMRRGPHHDAVLRGKPVLHLLGVPPDNLRSKGAQEQVMLLAWRQAAASEAS